MGGGCVYGGGARVSPGPTAYGEGLPAPLLLSRVCVIRRFQQRGYRPTGLMRAPPPPLDCRWVALQHAHLCPFADILLSGLPRTLHESRHLGIPPAMKGAMERQCNPSQV